MRIAASDGEEALEEFRDKGVVLEGELADYVDRVGQRVARAAGVDDMTFTLLDDSSVNAFAMQGGYIFVARGLLAYLEREDQLAAVLGHEVAQCWSLAIPSSASPWPVPAPWAPSCSAFSPAAGRCIRLPRPTPPRPSAATAATRNWKRMASAPAI
ncbi:MAG: M48 family metalloprotease [Gammaproteobacteria bacterium]|nr:M48 family metalloprotease [Gammaproteobacteria bacterium]